MLELALENMVLVLLFFKRLRRHRIKLDFLYEEKTLIKYCTNKINK